MPLISGATPSTTGSSSSLPSGQKLKFPPEAVTVLARGLAAIRPIAPDDPDQDHWNFGSARMPSYPAFGRLRALYAVLEAERLQPRRVLEIAAGDGALCATLRQRLHCQVVANDLRENQLRASLAKFTNRAEIEVLPGNVFNLAPGSLQPFDLVIACEVIEHVAHGVEFLAHLRQFLTPGGRLLLTTPNGAHFRNNLPGYYDIPDHAALESEQFKPDADGHLFLIRPAELHRMASEAGFTVERLLLWGSPFLTGHGMLHRFSGILPQALCRTAESALSGNPRLSFAMSAVLRPLPR